VEEDAVLQGLGVLDLRGVGQRDAMATDNRNLRSCPGIESPGEFGLFKFAASPEPEPPLQVVPPCLAIAWQAGFKLVLGASHSEEACGSIRINS